MKCIRILAYFCFVMTLNVQAKSAIPIEHFSHLPLIQQPVISPNGDNIAAIYNTDEGPVVVVAEFGSTEIEPMARLKKAKDRIDGVSWSGNRFVLVQTSYPMYIQGQFRRVSRIYSVDINAKKAVLLYSNRFAKYKYHKYQSYKLLSSLKNEEDHALVSTYDELDKDYSVFNVNLESRKFTKVVANKYEVDRWYANKQGRVTLGVQVEEKDDEILKTIWYRAKNVEKFAKLKTLILGKADTFAVQGIDESGNFAYVLSDRVDRREQLWLFDIVKGEFKEKVFGHDTYDIKSTITNSSGEIIGVTFIDDFVRRHYFLEVDGQVENKVKRNLPRYKSYITSMSKDRTRVIAYGIRDNFPGIYYTFDFAAKKANPWFSQYPHLVRQKLAPVNSFEFKASDGQALAGYVTLPQGVENPPVILYPHGGPHSRDNKFFDPYVQFFASRGYAVVQVNFRGSSGFGSDFLTAGYYEWGKRMQQDVMEALDWVEGNYAVSKDKTCVVGFSYGGYVALTAGFQQPERFSCLVSVAGISDLKELVEDDERQGLFVEHIVDKDDSESMSALSAVSALSHINKFKAPVLLIHGDKDTRVYHEQSGQFYSKARKKLDIEYIKLKNGTHFLDDPQNRKTAFSKIEAFLHQHLN